MRRPRGNPPAEGRHHPTLTQQDAALRVQLDVAFALRDDAGGGGRRHAFHAEHLLPARRHQLNVAAEGAADARRAIQRDVTLVGARRGFREQRGDCLAATQIAAVARAGQVVVFPSAGTQLGKINLPRKDPLLLGGQGGKGRARVVRAAGKAKALRHPQQQFGFVGLEGQALVHQRAAGVGRLGRVQIPRQERRVVRPLGAHARLHGNRRARAVVARHHRAQARDGSLVRHQHVTAGRHFQCAGARYLERAVQDVATGRHPRHIQRVAMQEQVAGRGHGCPACAKVHAIGGGHVGRRPRVRARGHDVAARQHPDGARCLVPGLAQVRALRDGQRLARAQPDDVAIAGIKARHVIGTRRAGGQRVEVEQGEMGVPVAGQAIGPLVAQGHIRIGLGQVARKSRRQHVGDAGRVRPRAVDGVAARVDGIPRQHFQLPARTRRQRQRIRQARCFVVQVSRRHARINTAVIRRGAQNRRVQIPPVGRRGIASRLRRQALRAMRRLPAGRQVAARAGQLNGRVLRPHREPAIAAARAHGAVRHAVGRAVGQGDTARIAGPADDQVAARIQADHRVARNQHQAARGAGHRGHVGVVATAFLHVLLAGFVAVLQIQPAHRAARQLGMAAQVDQRALQVQRGFAVIGGWPHGRGHQTARALRGVQAAPDTDVDIAAPRQRHAAVGRNAAGAAHGHDQALAARIVDGPARLDVARVAVHAQADVAAAQCPEAGEAHQQRRVVLERRGRARVAAEVDPPGGRRIAAIGAAGTLAPQPVADAHAGIYDARLEISARGLAPHIAAQGATRVQAEVATCFRVPRLIAGAGRHEGFIRGRVIVAQHRGLVAATGQLVGSVHVCRLRAGRVDAIRRHQAEVAARRQVQVARTRAQHAEILRMRHHRRRRIILDALFGR
ncbi:hypothetical protein D3C72_514630 [compost metagenome]